MTNWDIIQIVNGVLNKDLNGRAFTPEQYQTMINAASMRLFMRKLGLPQEYLRDMPIALEGVGVSQRIDNDLLPFLRVDTLYTLTGNINLPAEEGEGEGSVEGGIRCGVRTLSGSLTYAIDFTTLGTTNYDIANGLKIFNADGFDIGYESVTKRVNGFDVTVSTVNPITLHYQAIKYQ